MCNCKISAALSKGLGLQLFAQSKLTGKKPAAYLDISPLPTSTSHPLMWWMLPALHTFLPLFYFCVLLYMHMESKNWGGLRMRLDSTCLKVLSVAKHLQVSLLTHTTSVQELSIICKAWFWISYTAHIPNTGTSISVWHKKIKGPCSLVKLHGLQCCSNTCIK